VRESDGVMWIPFLIPKTQYPIRLATGFYFNWTAYCQASDNYSGIEAERLATGSRLGISGGGAI
jgi:hypothetical protein